MGFLGVHRDKLGNGRSLPPPTDDGGNADGEDEAVCFDVPATMRTGGKVTCLDGGTWTSVHVERLAGERNLLV